MKQIKTLKTLIFVIFLGLFSKVAPAQLEINGDEFYPLIDEIVWRYTTENDHSWKDIIDDKQEIWLKSPDAALSLGLIDDTVWVKFTIEVTKHSKVDEYILNLGNATIAKASLLHIHPNLYHDEKTPIGMSLKYGESRYMASPSNHFILDLRLQGTHEIFLKIEQNGYFDLPLSLQTPKRAFNTKIDQNFYANIFYGFFIALTLYHLFYFFIIRDPIYLSYLFFTTGIALQFGYMDGVLYKHFWPNFPILNEVAAKFAIPLISLSIILLAIHFLQLKNEHSFFKYINNTVLILNLISISIALFISLHISLLFSLSILLFTFICVPIITFVHYFIHRNPISLIFLLSITFFMVTCIVITMSIIGLTPIDINNLWDTLKIAMGVQMLVFASAIAFRVRAISQERKKALNESRAKSEMIARVSHEIRTPLNGILGLSHLMEPLLEGTTKSYNHMIHQSATALLTVINDLLDVSKINAGKFTINNQPTDIHDLVTSTSQSLYTQLKQEDVKGEIIISKIVPKYVSVDSDRLRQLISNILGNAIKFTHKGKITIEVNKIPHSSDCYRFSIRDTGDGISDEDMERIFNPYEQAQESTKDTKNSTGLGLFITQQLAKALGSEIKAESTLNEGSKFWFDLCLQQSNKPVNSNQNTTQPLKNLNILVAEDNEINQLIIKKLLTNIGHKVFIANNGQEALNALKANEYDMVFMDCDMPVLDGYQAVKQFRDFEKQNNKKPLIIYALTAHAYQGHKEKVKSFGMDGQILKPIKPHEIENLLRSLSDQF